MTDRLTSLDVNDDQEENKRQRIFDERFEVLTNGFGKACEDNNVQIAIAIAIHPEEEHPIIFAKGHQYDIAELLTKILKRMKYELFLKLDSDPKTIDDI